MPKSVTRLLEELEGLKRPAGPEGRGRLRGLLAEAARRRFTEPDALLRLHELLLFMRAHPQGPQLLRQTDALLRDFGRRVDEADAAGTDLTSLIEPETSGVARTQFSLQMSYETVRWLARAHASRAEVDWEDYDERGHVYLVWPLLFPLYEEDAYVDTHAPFVEWLRASKRRGETDLGRLVRAFERLPLSDRERAALFNPLRLWVRWRLEDSKAARTHARLPARKIFFHDKPFLTRREVSLARELDAPPLPVSRLAPREAERVLAVARDAMAVRYRELHGFSHPDPRTVRRAEAGRGVEIYTWGVPFAQRLPLVAYLAGMVFKNGLPAAYVEGLTLCERTEIGFNLFYTFRDGESAWAYARVMRLLRQLHGVETFAVEPYQLGGSGNEEGVASGAFWFYRKLGFRPAESGPARLLAAEERRLTASPVYRTPAATLRRLASGYAVYETRRAEPGAWDHFRFRHLGLAVQRRLRDLSEGDPARLRSASVRRVERALRVSTSSWRDDERRAFENFSLVLSLLPDLARWTPAEKRDLLRVVRAKAGPDELTYARLLRRHTRLRHSLLTLGSAEK